MAVSKTYDGLNRLTEISSVPSGGSAIKFNYAYNTANQRTVIINTDNSRWEHQYDNLGQVTNSVKRLSNGTAIPGYLLRTFLAS